MSPRALTVLLVCLCAPGLFAQSSSQAVDDFARDALSKRPISGFSVAIARGDEIVHASGYGFADVENDVPATEHTVYRIGSVTKQFTAAAILHLIEQDELSLDTVLSDIMPEFDTKGRRVDIHQLLNHTSGLPSYTAMQVVMQDEVRNDLSDDALMAYVQKEEFDFDPGTDWRYNNTGYYLLGMIVEACSGQTFEAYVETEFLKPLGLENTMYGHVIPLIKKRARGYRVSNGKLQNAPYMSMRIPGAAGAMCSTVLDLVAWNRGLVDGDVVSSSTYEKMITATTLESGKVHPYGYGLMPGDSPFGPRISHGGGIFGFSAMLSYYAEEDLTVAVLCNTEGAAGRLESEATAAYLKDKS